MKLYNGKTKGFIYSISITPTCANSLLILPATGSLRHKAVGTLAYANGSVCNIVEREYESTGTSMDEMNAHIRADIRDILVQGAM